jgi:hypothetical protein
MRRVVVLAALLVSTVAQAAGNPVDVFDRPIAPVLTRNQPKLILYANQKTEDQIAHPGDLIAAHLKNVPYITVVRVDLRGVPGFFLGMARKVMQGRQTEGNEKYSELARAAGLKPPEASERLHLVMEADGAAHQSMGLGQGFGHALAVVLDNTGREILRTAFPEGANLVEKALREAAQPAPATPAAPQVAPAPDAR